MDKIIPDLALNFEGHLTFRLIGDGNGQTRLKEKLEVLGVKNVELVCPMSRANLITEYLESDVLFLHLGKQDAFKKVLPSKIFEYGAFGKPIWAGVSGFAKDFLQSELKNVAVFQPENANDALRVFRQLNLKEQPTSEFKNKFSRANVSSQMAADIIGVIVNE